MRIESQQSFARLGLKHDGDNVYCLPSCALAKIKPDYSGKQIMWKCFLQISY